jgi:hypothetical protein
VSGAARQHSLKSQFGPEDDTQDVDLDLPPGYCIVLFVGVAGRHDARVVDQDVEGSEFTFDQVQKRCERVRFGDVESGDDLHPEFGGGLLRTCLVDVADGDPVASSNQLLRCLIADAASSTGDRHRPGGGVR